MIRLLDDGLDELAERGQQGSPLRLAVTAAVAGLASVVLDPKTALIWLALAAAAEVTSNIVYRLSKAGRIRLAWSRLAYLASFLAGGLVWIGLGVLAWSTGRPLAMVFAADLWLSVLFFSQMNAYQSPTAFVAGALAPFGAALAWVAFGPNPQDAPIWPAVTLFALSMMFSVDGVVRAMAVRKEFEAAQDRLRASEAQYRLLADNVSDVIALNSMSGQRVYMSPSIERVMGFTPDDLFRTNNYTFLHPDDGEWVPKALSELAAKGGRTTLQYRVMHKDGHPLWVETSFATIPPEVPGGDTMMISVSRDIEARKKMEAELLEARHRAELAAAAKSEFLANMTHELRTPLNAIIGFAGILRRSSRLHPEDARQVRLIHEASATLLELVNDVLDYSKLEAGAVNLETRAFSPTETVSGIALLMAEQFPAKGLDLKLETAGLDRPLMGDPARIRQVLLNFLSNAMKFTPTGGVTVRLEQSQADDARDRLRVAVEDTGIGVAPDQIAQLFDRFTQADASVSRRYGGTGLGLAICKRNIELMGGRIGAESAPGQGSTFWFELDLPVATADAAAGEAAPAPAAPDRALKLLVVEDVAVNRELIQALLSPFDIEIAMAEDGAQAVERMQDETFDIVLMDVQMPVMDGLTATRAIRALPSEAARATPIIAMTANVLPEQVGACLEAGMNDHLGKPIDPSALLQVLSRWTSEDEAAA